MITQTEALAMAREAGFRSPKLLEMYGNKLAALCKSELQELLSIQSLVIAAYTRGLEDAARVCQELGAAHKGHSSKRPWAGDFASAILNEGAEK